MLSKLSYLKSNLALTLGYPNPSLNNSALSFIYKYFGFKSPFWRYSPYRAIIYSLIKVNVTIRS